MRTKQNCRAGFTLAELCIVLSLLAILITTIATFSILINNITVERAAELTTGQDLTTFYTQLDMWLNTFDSSEWKISASGSKLQATKGSETYTFTVVDGTISGKLSDDVTIGLAGTDLVSVSFGITEGGDNGSRLVIAEVTYNKRDKTETRTYLHSLRTNGGTIND